MGRKKKVVEEKKAEEGVPMEQTPLVVPVESVGQNGTAPVPEPVPEVPGVRNAIHDDAMVWAIECGFTGTLFVNGPERVDYPREGYGYCVTIKEQDGKQRLGSARYTSSGVRSYWSIDGIVTG